MQTELIKELNKVLKDFPQFWSGENLHRSMVSDAISQKQPDLIKALVDNKKIRSIYGTDINGTLIFDFDKLCSLLKYKEYWENSFTKYRNKIGLTSSGKYLDYNSDVVLDFPFKDCVLEGGMSKEDQGKNEIYYNEIIARDEIDRLLSPKIFTNVKRHTKDGVKKNISYFDQGDNLIIKGNNLIALHSLKECYAGKIKLIYIDPPYNTGSDSFKYNDKFIHSTWLSFMKNRLSIAKELLSENGCIFISCDDHESHYLKVLLDEIFCINNFICNVIWQKKYTVSNDAKYFSDNHDHILIYSKNKEAWSLNRLARTEEMNQRYANPDNHPKGKWKATPLHAKSGKNKNFSHTFKNGVVWTPPQGTFPRFSNETLKKLDENNEIWFGVNGTSMPSRKTFLSELSNHGIPPATIWMHSDVGNNHDAKNELKSLNNENIFSTPKPEKLIQRIIHIGSNEGDLVLDFHLGSGTTAAVAHKMGRRYIGIEQMDYINDITVPRLQKVIEGEQGGISKDVNWQGGGSFVYAELMELNAYFMHEIQKAQSNEELEKLFAVMKTEAHLNYQVALENVLSAEYEMDGIPRKVTFSELELHEQKQLLIEILDKNQLYVNASEMDDSDLNISESDKAFTRSFYGME